ncbi:uncharacterized protein [Nicotiana sylvestris]|uniref:uncharacterized protein n=1 Tax=Nicotiana sylvestris TaxID=4096 RepID=UPI00388CAFB4
MADALRRKLASMGNLAYILVDERSLAFDVQALANQFLSLDVSEPSHVLACTIARSSLIESIRDRQYDDPHLLVLRDTVRHGGAKQVTVRDDGVLRMQGHICVPNVDGLRELILEESHSSQMKRDIVAYVARCLNCQQVMYEHQRPGGLLQQIEILEWKWERITMDFIVGLPLTQRKFDAVWVIVDRLTKSAYFTDSEIYIREIVRLHGVLVYIISD